MAMKYKRKQIHFTDDVFATGAVGVSETPLILHMLLSCYGHNVTTLHSNVYHVYKI